jgi:2-hydroxychromene-2-carboxylate isomerase
VLTLFHDFTSPGSALAVARVQRLADEGLPVVFEGFEALGVDVELPASLDVLAEVERLAPVAALEGVVLRRPRRMPPTGPAHLVAELAAAADLAASWRGVCYRGFWSDGLDLADRAVLARLASAAGLDTAPVVAALADRAALAALRRRMAAHRRNGVGGVPTILAARTLVPGLLAPDELRRLAELG